MTQDAKVRMYSILFGIFFFASGFELNGLALVSYIFLGCAAIAAWKSGYTK